MHEKAKSRSMLNDINKLITIKITYKEMIIILPHEKAKSTSR